MMQLSYGDNNMVNGKVSYKTKSKQKNKDTLLSLATYVMVIGLITIGMMSI